MKRAVFSWEGVEAEDKELLEKYQIDTIFMDINYYSSISNCNTFYASISNYNIFILAGVRKTSTTLIRVSTVMGTL